MAKFKDKIIKQSKLDWQKTDSLGRVLTHQRYNKDCAVRTKQVIESWQNTSWPIKGKYHGTKLKNLPLDYLQWVGLNFNTNSKGFKLALQELECRTNNT
jgi:uncharacterized protein (DUF3820 family)